MLSNATGGGNLAALGGQGPNSVYGELKLSEKLAAELGVVKDECNHYKELLEEALYHKDKLFRENHQLKTDLIKSKKQFQDQKKEILEVRQRNWQQEITSAQMIKSSKALTDFVKVSELYRKGFAEKLRQSLCLNDDLKNQIFELDQNKKLTQISYEIVQTKLNMLYESMTAISNAKNLEDKF